MSANELGEVVAVAGQSSPGSLRQTLVAITIAFALLAMMTVSAHAQEFVELPPELDARAAHLYDSIMCPICNGQTISQSNSEIASTMRLMVRERLLAGDTDQEILDFMADAFGEDILASPPTVGIGLAVWVIPPVAVLLGAVAVTMAIGRLRRREQVGTQPTFEGRAAGEADPFLALVDREMEGKP